jgi:hypothetical protein
MPLTLHLTLGNHVGDDACMPLARGTLASALLALLAFSSAVEASTDDYLPVPHYMLLSLALEGTTVLRTWTIRI